MGYRMNLSKIACAWLLVGLLGAGVSACGDDDDDGDAGSGGNAGGSAGTSGSGAGSGGTKAGSGGMSGAGAGGSAGSMAMTKMCGTKTCMGITAQGRALPPCCDTKNADACGVQTSMTDATECVALMQEGMADTRCPSADSVAGTVVPGCCKMGNKCGLMSGTLMGCVERTQYPTGFLMMVNMMPPPKLSAIACDAAGMDAGME